MGGLFEGCMKGNPRAPKGCLFFGIASQPVTNGKFDAASNLS